MQSVSYYSEFISESDLRRDDRYLAVNCTGHAVYPYPPRANSTRHDYYLLYMIKGTLAFRRPKLAQSLTDGQIIILEAEKPFAYDGISPAVDYYWVHFSGREAEALLASCRLTLNTPFTVGRSDHYLSSFLALFLAFSDKSLLAEEKRARSLLDILLAFSEEINRPERADSRAAELVARSTTYIHEHIAENLTVSDLAAREYLSIGRYRDLFRRVSGMSPQEYILRLRIHTACDLLKNTTLPIAEIALAVGYPDAHYFSRLFEKRLNITPTAYRKTQK